LEFEVFECDKQLNVLYYKIRKLSLFLKASKIQVLIFLNFRGTSSPLSSKKNVIR